MPQVYGARPGNRVEQICGSDVYGVAVAQDPVPEPIHPDVPDRRRLHNWLLML
jgi:hypothetical protein